jgi:hypothetical protein
MSATYTPKEVKLSLRKKKQFNLKKLEDLDAKDYENLFAKKSFEQRSILMLQIIKSQGEPFELLENDLELLRKTGLDEDTLEIIAIYLIYTKIYTDPNERQAWSDQKKAYQNFINTPYAEKRPTLIQEIECERRNIQGRFQLDFLSETVGILMEIIPLESKRKRSVIISELLRELDIQLLTPFYTLEEAIDEADRNDTYQDGVSIIYDRIKKFEPKFKKMIENTISLLKQNNL